MFKFTQIILVLTLCAGCGENWSFCDGYHGFYNNIKKPAYLDSLNPWTFLLKDTLGGSDTMRIDSFYLDTFITQNVTPCNEECETITIQGFGENYQFGLRIMAEPSNGFHEAEDELILFYMLEDKKKIIDENSYDATIRINYNKGVMLVRNSLYTLKRLE